MGAAIGIAMPAMPARFSVRAAKTIGGADLKATRYQVRLLTWMLTVAFGTPMINGLPLFASVVADLRFARKCSRAEREFRDEWERAADRSLRGPH
jgi:hypothetical protein